MALSQEEWFKKLKQMVPSWVFERNKFNEAKFKGLAKILEQVQIRAEDHVGETYIDSAEGDFLDVHADERSVESLPGESISVYRERIKSIINNSSCPNLKLLVDALLIVGQSTFIENYESNNFYNREGFYSRKTMSHNIDYNAFTVLIDKQIPEPVSFYTREDFYRREDTYGSNVSVSSIFENIIEVINNNKAFGTVYRLIERGAS